MLHTGIQWKYLPLNLGFGSGMTCWRRLRDWHEAGLWQRLHEVLLAELNAAGELDWSRVCADGSHVRAKNRRVFGPQLRCHERLQYRHPVPWPALPVPHPCRPERRPWSQHPCNRDQRLGRGLPERARGL